VTTQISVQVINKPTLKAAVLPRFPANIRTEAFLNASRINGTYVFDVDYTLLNGDAILDPSQTLIAVYDEGAQEFKQMTLSSLISSTTQIEQHITDAGPVDILPNAGIVRVDQDTGAPITLTLPLASDKTCPVLISDWKGDAGTNNITIALSGSDKFPGGLTTWTIGADAGSVFLRPITGAGYVL
jgi:hypothetical protein